MAEHSDRTLQTVMRSGWQCGFVGKINGWPKHWLLIGVCWWEVSVDRKCLLMGGVCWWEVSTYTRCLLIEDAVQTCPWVYIHVCSLDVFFMNLTAHLKKSYHYNKKSILYFICVQDIHLHTLIARLLSGGHTTLILPTRELLDLQCGQYETNYQRQASPFNLWPVISSTICRTWQLIIIIIIIIIQFFIQMAYVT